MLRSMIYQYVLVACNLEEGICRIKAIYSIKDMSNILTIQSSPQYILIYGLFFQ